LITAEIRSNCGSYVQWY